MRSSIQAMFVGLLLAGTAVAADPVDYLRDVKPLLAQHCYLCHGAKAHKGDLRLDTAAAIRKGGNSGPAVVPAKSQESPLIQAVEGVPGMTRMPFKRPALAPAQIAVLKAWIDGGAEAPAREKADDGSTGTRHWAFIPPVRPSLPEVKDPSAERNPIDRFIRARLEQEGITPSPEADRITLIRRLSLDLLGLPPTIHEVDAFRADERPDAYERLVDRFLHSPHYGERWGRHWLDLARYADSNGYSIDAPREIWKYRDWVINALNQDMPFPEFVIEQMAGDLLPRATVEQQVATGFHRNTQINQEGGIDPEQFRVEAVADRVSTTGVVFLGLTLGCARCHDHKFDPITQQEYYQFFAFLNNQEEPALALAEPTIAAQGEAVQKRIDELAEEYTRHQQEWLKNLPEERRSHIDRNIQVILNLGYDQRDRKQKQTLLAFFKKREPPLYARLKALQDLEQSKPKFPTTMVLKERAKPRETFVHVGGDFTRHGERVSPGVPAVLPALSGVESPNRLALARWLVDAGNPLTARVTVNRMWQHYFGKGLVETENDFGTQGSPPTHPELLDWLATEFVGSAERGVRSAELPSTPHSALRAPYSMKALHRLIVTSATYRQSSRHGADLAKRDPYNRLLGRQARLRLDAEVIRDLGLAASGLLDRKIGGPSVFPPQPPGVFRFTQVPREWKASNGGDRYRRGMYTFFWRAAPHPALTVFDAPDAVSACTRRVRSNTPLQALTLLNDEAFLESARALAGRVLHEAPAGEKQRLQYLFRLCLARPPSPSESRRLQSFLSQQREEFRQTPADAQALLPVPLPAETEIPEGAAWTALARALLNLDEFVTRE
jgi:hypothetical protein